MTKLPYTLDIKIKSLTPENLDPIINRPFCFFLDSAEHGTKSGRYSFAGIDPVRIFYSSGGFITVDNHTFIDNPVHALEQFESLLGNLPFDPYLPFHGGLVGFVGHTWPRSENFTGDSIIPDAWFGLYDTILTYDHLEDSCWISSLGLSKDGKTSLDLAKYKCERILELLNINPEPEGNKYIIKPLIPEPFSSFTEDKYVKAVGTAKENLGKKEWLRATLAQRFHAPVAVTGWSIHKMLRGKNPTPFASFLRCGNFEILSTSPSCFLGTKNDWLTCNVVQKSIPADEDKTQDRLSQIELLHSAPDHDPVVTDDEHSLGNLLTGKAEITPAHLESDSRSHYLVNQIKGKKRPDLSTSKCLATAMPGASMTGVPKAPVNNWIRTTEPAQRNIYTGSIGYIGSRGNSQFNMAVRTMIVKDQTAFVHAGCQIEKNTEAEEAYYKTQTNINRLFEDIKGLGSVGGTKWGR